MDRDQTQKRNTLDLNEFRGRPDALLEAIISCLTPSQFVNYNHIMIDSLKPLSDIIIGTPETDEDPYHIDYFSPVHTVFCTMLPLGYGNNPDFREACKRIYVHVDANREVTFMIKVPIEA